MILKERQQLLNDSYSHLESINRRRAYISIMHLNARMKFADTKDDKDQYAVSKYQSEIQNIDSKMTPLVEQLRKVQTKYEVEYEGEVSSEVKPYREEIFLFVDCDINTFRDGWDLEEENAEELLYEMADYLLQFKSSKFWVKNIKKL